MKAVFVLFNSLNRTAISCYGETWIHTPNFARFAARAVAFDGHFVGSLPCMPARRDLHTGRLNFLHRSWGPLEPFDNSFPEMLREANIHSHLVTDHMHYFEDGGATYSRAVRYLGFRARTGRRPVEGDGSAARRPFPREVQAPSTTISISPATGSGCSTRSIANTWSRKRISACRGASRAPSSSSRSIARRTTGSCSWNASIRMSRSTPQTASRHATARAGTAARSIGRITPRSSRAPRRSPRSALITPRC